MPDAAENTSLRMPAIRNVPPMAGSSSTIRPRRRMMVPPPVGRVKKSRSRARTRARLLVHRPTAVGRAMFTLWPIDASALASRVGVAQRGHQADQRGDRGQDRGHAARGWPGPRRRRSRRRPCWAPCRPTEVSRKGSNRTRPMPRSVPVMCSTSVRAPSTATNTPSAREARRPSRATPAVRAQTARPTLKANGVVPGIGRQQVLVEDVGEHPGHAGEPGHGEQRHLDRLDAGQRPPAAGAAGAAGRRSGSDRAHQATAPGVRFSRRGLSVPAASGRQR